MILADVSRLADAHLPLFTVLKTRFDRAEQRRRKEKLRELGYPVPTDWQLLKAGAEMLRLHLYPTASFYHQALRTVLTPSANVDPTGLSSTEDILVLHLLQSVHTDPRYDLQLLPVVSHAWDPYARLLGGLARAAHGRHRMQKLLNRTAPPTYHERLRAYVKRFIREGPSIGPLDREETARLRATGLMGYEDRFGDLPAFLRYASSL